MVVQVAVNLIVVRKVGTISHSRQTADSSLEVSHLVVLSSLWGGAFSAAPQYTPSLAQRANGKNIVPRL